MISSLTYFVAVDQGYFTEEGIEVTGIPITTSNTIASSIEAGDIDVGVELTVVPLLNQLKEDGSKAPSFWIFSASTITAENGFDAVLTKPSSSIKTLQDLSGRKVGVFPGTTAAKTLLDVFQKKYPTSPLPVPMPMSPALQIPALESGEVEAIHAYEPFLSIGIAENQLRLVHTSLYAEQLSPNPIGVAAINREFYKRSPSSARKAIAALDRAASFIQAYPDLARIIVAKYTGTQGEVAKIVHIMPMSSSSQVDVDRLNRYFEILAKMKEISFVPDAKTLRFPKN